jgi:hypothetical protein
VVKNLVVHITLPRGIRTKSGASLRQEVTFDFVGAIEPYYCSVEQVRFEGGMYLKDVPTYTIACSIYQSSCRADLFCTVPPLPGSKLYQMYAASRQNWVQAAAAQDLIVNIQGLILTPGAHVLGNFSVTRQAMRGQGPLDSKLKDLAGEIETYERVLRAGGQITPGAHVRPAIAAKGVNDWAERTPTRTWAVTGMGANMTSWPMSATGGRGKSYQMFLSPPIASFRHGIFPGTYSLMIAPRQF